MELGVFSLSLAVKDLSTSIDFYSKLGFEVTGGDEESWAILVNGATVIGVFQGMFDDNILTFNPGLGGPAQFLDSFTDVRQLRDAVTAAGIEVRDDTTAESDAGPASFVMIDPDGNPILIDQHM
ncbi:MAG: VOC family protein [Acidimicrobiales bacterium]